MRLHASILLIASLALSGCPEPDPTASAYLIERRDQWIGGPAADAREGKDGKRNSTVKERLCTFQVSLHGLLVTFCQKEPNCALICSNGYLLRTLKFTPGP